MLIINNENHQNRYHTVSDSQQAEKIVKESLKKFR